MLIAIVALIVIGPEQMPSVLRAVAKIIREVRTAANEVVREFTEALEEEPPQPKPKLNPPEDLKPPSSERPGPAASGT